MLAGAIVASVLAGACAPSASAATTYFDPEQFQLESFTTRSSNMVAGGHPDVSTAFRIKTEIHNGRPYGFGRLRRVEVDMPHGLVGDPTDFPTCPIEVFQNFLEYAMAPPGQGDCPPETQVGVVNVTVTEVFTRADRPIFNLEHGPDEPVLLGMKISGQLWGYIRVKVRPDGGLTAIVDEIPSAHPILASDLTLWGVPADRNPANAARTWPRVPFMSAPTECTTIPTTTMRIYSYEGKVDEASHSLDSPPERCDSLSFNPRMTATPTERRAAGPTGLDVSIDLPQNAMPDGRATAHVKEVRIALPEGMKVSPSSAHGLSACSPAEFGYRTDSAIVCPDASRIGTVRIRTPLLNDPMRGSVFLARQSDNPFGSLLALYLVAEGSGVAIKLAGKVDPDPVTGRLTATFDNNPQLPFERLDVAFKTGPTAPLTNPQVCGEYHSQTTITSWGGQSVSASTPMSIDQDCGAGGFNPRFEAGSVNPSAGHPSTFSLTFARGDHDQELRDITVDMPQGLTGKIADAVLCQDAAANVGACGPASQIGSVTTSAGPGSNPYWLPGRAYVTESYEGAPFGMSIVVPAVAGPFNLGNVVVRAAIFVDRRTASLRVVSDPMPRILQGIPLQVRSVNVAIDKPGFMINPTSCDVKQIAGRIGSQQGAAVDRSSRFQVGGCGSLPIRQRMRLTVGARGRTGVDRRTPFTAVVRQVPGLGNLRQVDVVLPKTLNGRLDVIQRDRACTMAQFSADRCPVQIGEGVATTPLLRDPLRGPAYFVYNPDRRLPDIVVRLRGQVDIDLVGKVTIPRDLTLRTSFDAVPDVPMSMFRLRLNSGENNGPIGVVRNLCTRDGRRGRARITMIGHNGRRVDVRQKLRIRGCRRGSARAQRRAERRQARRDRARRSAARKASVRAAKADARR